MLDENLWTEGKISFQYVMEHRIVFENTNNDKNSSFIFPADQMLHRIQFTILKNMNEMK